jgi:16S rRNA (adenine1518-N6/adenine1519-N6)-dimethyltransferase
MTKQIKPLKKYGQNFLRNKQIAEKIVAALNCGQEDNILEIGAGEGVLTEHLIRHEYKSITVIEIDQRLAKLLEEKFSGQIDIVKDSVLDVALDKIAGTDRLKVIGNIPYYITSDIVFKLLDNYRILDRAVLMVQKEVADRLIADTKTKDYGLLTIFSGLYSTVEKLFDVSRDEFFPVPNVDSSVVCFNFNVHPDKDVDYKLLKKIVRAGFNLRRKKLRNSLSKIISAKLLADISSISLDRRPEELTIDEFKLLTTEIAHIME